MLFLMQGDNVQGTKRNQKWTTRWLFLFHHWSITKHRGSYVWVRGLWYFISPQSKDDIGYSSMRNVSKREMVRSFWCFVNSQFINAPMCACIQSHWAGPGGVSARLLMHAEVGWCVTYTAISLSPANHPCCSEFDTVWWVWDITISAPTANLVLC